MRAGSDLVSVFQLTVEKLLSPPGTDQSSNRTDQQYKRTHSYLLRIMSEHSSVLGDNDVKRDCRGQVE